MAYIASRGLIRIRDKVNSTWVSIPLKYMRYEEYKVTPDQMIDLDSYVSETGVLIRNVLSHTRSKIEFNTPYITSTDWNTLWSLISTYFTSASERKVTIQYYDPLTDDYKTANCYVPDVEFTVRNIDNGIINYDGIRVAFIEY